MKRKNREPQCKADKNVFFCLTAEHFVKSLVKHQGASYDCLELLLFD